MKKWLLSWFVRRITHYKFKQGVGGPWHMIYVYNDTVRQSQVYAVPGIDLYLLFKRWWDKRKIKSWVGRSPHLPDTMKMTEEERQDYFVDRLEAALYSTNSFYDDKRPDEWSPTRDGYRKTPVEVGRLQTTNRDARCERRFR
jgi:hypothetical protein